jgi:FixJ family two-component response regulator
MSGFELLEVLQSRNIRIPTVLVTGRSDKGIRDRASMAGVLALLEKPIDFDRLMAALTAVPSHT